MHHPCTPWGTGPGNLRTVDDGLSSGGFGEVKVKACLCYGRAWAWWCPVHGVRALLEAKKRALGERAEESAGG